MPKLLIFTPTYANGPMAETLESIKLQRSRRVKWTHHVSWHNPSTDAMLNVLAQYQLARKMVLSEDYDALLAVEHDMRLPDKGAVQRMWDTDAGVVYAPYLLRHGQPSISLWRKEERPEMGLTLSLYGSELKRYRELGVGPVSGVGLGCTLIRRKVLEAIPFRGKPGVACDMPFAIDCLKRRIDALGRFDVPCDHWNGERWLSCYGDDSELVRVRALVTQDGMKVDRYYTRSYAEAQKLSAEGLIDLCPL